MGKMFLKVQLTTLVLCFLFASSAQAVTPTQQAQQILDTTGVKGGLIVHLGCGDGQLTAAMGAGDSYVVHGLDSNTSNVTNARSFIQSQDLYGRVSAHKFSSTELPYIDNMVNLFVSNEPVAIDSNEILRVLVPNGAAYIYDGNNWNLTVKPWPADMDEWSHYLRSSNNNAVSQDAKIGPPRHVQWIFEPKWTRSHHKLNSVSTVVTAKGRIFYIFDKGPVATLDVGAKWFLIAQDAFNGIILWEKQLDNWADILTKFRSGPVQLPRTLVTDGDYVYLPMGISTSLTAINTETGVAGEVTYQDTNAVEEIIYDNDILYVLCGSPTSEQFLADYPNRKSISAIDANSGTLQWKYNSPNDITPVTLAVEGGNVFFHSASDVVCLDKATGNQNWRTATNSDTSRKAGWADGTLVVSSDVLLAAISGQLTALSVTDGSVLWSTACGTGMKSPVDVFVIDGKVWVGQDFAQSYDLHTGAVGDLNTIMFDLQTAGHHHRCYREKATNNYIIGGHRGMEFMDLDGDEHSRHNWIRGGCQYGILPANGLSYTPPHACGCYMETKIFGFTALAGSRTPWTLTTPEPRLEQGPAYGTVQITDSYPNDWPSYRYDGKRSATTVNGLPNGNALDVQWQTTIGGRLSAPTVAEGKLLVADIEAHRILALDANDGSQLWTYTAGGRIDSPPTAYNGMVFFGSNDGCVYNLALSDGSLIWRFRAAPVNMYAMGQENVESVWPVPGSILVQNDTVYFAAGRSSYLDDGIFFFGLDPRTGAVKYSNQYKSIHAGIDTSTDDGEGIIPINQNDEDYKTRTHPDLSDAFSMAGTIADILTGDGNSVYMKALRFDNTLTEQAEKKTHYFSTSNILDGEENHRSHAVFGTGDFSRTPVAYSWTAYKNNKTKWLQVPFGLKLAFNENKIWGAVRGTLYNNANTTVLSDKYVLYSKNMEDYNAPDYKDKPAGATYTFNWQTNIDMRPRAMITAGSWILVGGMPDRVDIDDPFAVIEGQRDGLLKIYDANTGNYVTELALESPPVWDGIAAVNGHIYLSLENGKIITVVPVMGPDIYPPSPNPATWSQVPTATGETEISMTATTAADPCGPVEYYFQCTTDGNHSSTWQTNPTYTDTSLAPGTTCSYQVQTRDGLGNIGGWSTAETATTHQEITESTILFNAILPTHNVLLSNTDIGTSQFRISDTTKSGQTFTFNKDFLLDAITFHLKKDAQANPYPAGAEMILYVYTSWPGSTVTDGTLVGSTTFNIEGLSFLQGKYATFRLHEDATNAIGELQANTEYTIILGSNQSDADSRIYITRDADVNPYADGTGVFNSNIQSNRDTTFYLQGHFKQDINADGDINFEDFECIARYWLGPCSAPTWCTGADQNKSGTVDFQDVQTLTQSWLNTP